MLRVVPCKSAAAACAYFTEGLTREDYYSEGQEVPGKWYGKAAARLSLEGMVTLDTFSALAENRHPLTGEKLTQRMKADRVVGADFNFHAPKSLSVVHALTGDERIATAFRSAVAETMAELEGLTETRVRKGGIHENRQTGNLAWAEFLHLTARPVGGVPDPHLHVHCFTFNATYDGKEDRWKAVKFRNLKANAPYLEAAFHARLSIAVAQLGYGIERTAKGWEVTGISRSIIDRFSRRKEQIEALAKERGISDAKTKDELGAKSRERKAHGVAYSALREEWESRLTAEELTKLKSLRNAPGTARKAPFLREGEALDYAIEKLFAKNSVVSVNRLLAEACQYGVGSQTPGELWREFSGRKMIVREFAGQTYCTSVDVLAEEVALINFVRTGRGRYASLVDSKSVRLPVRFSAEEKAAIRHALTSHDQVIAIRGGAGVGKTTLMKEIVPAIERGGTKVFAFAPSATASRETLREAGFENAQTVAHLLNNPKLQKEVRGQVLWIDEAGLLGIRDLWQIMKIAGNDTRIILTGDTAQHSPVPRGDAFRLLQQYSGLNVAEVTQIRRQEIAAYREAVSALSKADLRSAFRQLDQMGVILEIENEQERYRLLAEDYVTSGRGGVLPLVVSPTHAEAAKVVAAIRNARQSAGELRDGRNFVRFHQLQWEEADRKRPDSYWEGLVVQFHQNAKGVKRGELFRVSGKDAEGRVLAVADSGREIALPLNQASRFLVYEERPIEVARGERIRITRNGETADGRRINNGNVFTVEKFTRAGDIVLTTGAVLSRKHGHFHYGYCETSHSSQSKSVRDVIVAQSADSFNASSREQFYVSVSRGKSSIRIYTDDREGLQQAVGNSAHRRSAVELAGLSAKQISSFMQAGLNADQWRARVRSLATEGKEVKFVENVMKQRGLGAQGKSANETFQEYVAARRQNATAAGKHRSKGYNTAPPTKPQSKELGKRSFIRPTSPKTEPKKTQPKQAGPTRIAKAEKSLKNSIKNLKGVLSRKEKLPKATAREQPKSTIKTSAKQRVRQWASDKVKKAKAKAQVMTKKMAPAKKPPTPPPPTMRRGR